MFLLRPDIAADLVHAGLAHRDGEIAGLPLETPSDLLVLIDPAGGIRFDEADRLRDRKVCLELSPAGGHGPACLRNEYLMILQKAPPLTSGLSSSGEESTKGGATRPAGDDLRLDRVQAAQDLRFIHSDLPSAKPRSLATGRPAPVASPRPQENDSDASPAHPDRRS